MAWWSAPQEERGHPRQGVQTAELLWATDPTLVGAGGASDVRMTGAPDTSPLKETPVF